MKVVQRWVIPDGYLPAASQGEQTSHESVCVLNLGESPAHLTLTLYYEDKPPQKGFHAECPGERCHHIRLDQIQDDAGRAIVRGVPYALLVESDVPLIVQHTRLDSSQPALALMTTLAHPLPPRPSVD